MTDKLLIDRTLLEQALDALLNRTGGSDQVQRIDAAITALCAALAQEPEPVQEPSYERGFIDGMQKQAESSVDKAVTQMALRAQERATPVKPAPPEPKFFDTVLYTGASERVTVVSSVSSVSVPTQPYRVLTDADLDAIRKIVREGEEK